MFFRPKQQRHRADLRIVASQQRRLARLDGPRINGSDVAGGGADGKDDVLQSFFQRGDMAGLLENPLGSRSDADG